MVDFLKGVQASRSGYVHIARLKQDQSDSDSDLSRYRTWFEIRYLSDTWTDRLQSMPPPMHILIAVVIQNKMEDSNSGDYIQWKDRESDDLLDLWRITSSKTGDLNKN